MREKTLAVAISLLVLISGVVVFGIFLFSNDNGPGTTNSTTSDIDITTTDDGDSPNPYPLDQTGYQFEKSTYFLTPDRIFFRVHADDANISISYSDRFDLLYSINVTPYQDSPEASITFDVHAESWGVYFGAGRQEYVNIVLGTHCFYFIYMVDNSNLNTTITYSNNAWVNGSAIQYVGEDCDLYLRINDDMQPSDTIGFTGSINCRTLNLEVQVPADWKGYIDFNDSNLTVEEYSGWIEFGYNLYRTLVDDEEYPSIELSIDAEEVYASLNS